MTTDIFIVGAQFSKSKASARDIERTSRGQGSLNISRIRREKISVNSTDRTLSNAVSYEKPTHAHEN